MLARMHLGQRHVQREVELAVAAAWQAVPGSVGAGDLDRHNSGVVGEGRRAGLRLIICGGVFYRTADSYVDNIVVYASLVGSTSA